MEENAKYCCCKSEFESPLNNASSADEHYLQFSAMREFDYAYCYLFVDEVE
jgi:hypothetical protein